MKRLIALAFILSTGYAHAANVQTQITGNGAQATLPMISVVQTTTYPVVSGGNTNSNVLKWTKVLKSRDWSLGTTVNPDGVSVSTFTFPGDGWVHGTLHDCDFWDNISTVGVRAAFTKIDGNNFTVRALFINSSAVAGDPTTRSAYSAAFEMPVTSTSTLVITLVQNSGFTLGPGCTDLTLRYTELGTQPVRGW